jgi:hypothetical protein
MVERRPGAQALKNTSMSDCRQRGRAVLQPPSIISRSTTAVVEGSTVTSFTSGGAVQPPYSDRK